MKKKSLIIFIIILVLASFLRLYMIKEIPYLQTGYQRNDENIFFSKTKKMIEYKLPERDYYFINKCGYGSGGLYINLPFVYLIDEIYAVRVTIAIMNIATIFILYFFTREISNNKIALLSIFLFAISPTVIESSRKGLERGCLAFFVVLILFFLYKWQKTKNKIYLWSSSLIAGFTIFMHLSIIFFILALITIAIIFKKIKHLKSSHILGSILFFTIGLSPFIIGNIRFDFVTLRCIKENAIITAYGVKNFDYPTNLFTRFTHLIHVMDSFYGELIQFFVPISILLILSCIYFVRYKNKKFILLVSIVFFTLLFSPFTISVIYPMHLIYIAPICFILISAFLLNITKNRNSGYIVTFILIFLISIPSILAFTIYINQYYGTEFGYKAVCKYLGGKTRPIVLNYCRRFYITFKEECGLNQKIECIPVFWTDKIIDCHKEDLGKMISGDKYYVFVFNMKKGCGKRFLDILNESNITILENRTFSITDKGNVREMYYVFRVKV